MPLKHPKGPSGPSHHLSPAAAVHARGRQDPAPHHAGRLDGAGRRVPGRPRRADAGRQRPPQPGHVRQHLGRAAGAAADADCLDKNMIDKDEYPQTAELEMRCVNMLARLWHAPDAAEATGCSTTGSSEAAMLGGLALKRNWQHRRRAAGLSTEKPNLVMGINVQICWEKFANYWDVEMRLVPMEGDRFTLSAEEAVKLCDENTIGVVAILGLDVRRRLRAGRGDLRRARRPAGAHRARRPRARRRRLGRVRRAVRRPAAAVGLPAAAGGVDQRLRPQVRPRVPRRRLDRVARREGAAGGPDLLGQLPRRQHADVRPQLLAARRPGRAPVLQLPAARVRRVPARAGLRARRRHAPVGEHRAAGAVRAPDARRRAAGVRVQGQGRRRELHGVRRVGGAPRARLAGARLHVPGQPHRPRGAAGGRAPRRSPTTSPTC